MSALRGPEAGGDAQQNRSSGGGLELDRAAARWGRRPPFDPLPRGRDIQPVEGGGGGAFHPLRMTWAERDPVHCGGATDRGCNERTGGVMATRTASCNCGELSVTYEGPDPERITLCHCYECQKRTGSILSVQARLPKEHVTIEGQSTTWTFPVEGAEPATFRSCDSGGVTYRLSARRCGLRGTVRSRCRAGRCPSRRLRVFTDPIFPKPIASGFKAYPRFRRGR